MSQLENLTEDEIQEDLTLVVLDINDLVENPKIVKKLKKEDNRWMK